MVSISIKYQNYGYDVDFISDNVFFCSKTATIGYVYKLDTLNSLYSIVNSEDKKSLGKIVEKLNMPVHIIKVPKKFDPNKEIRKTFDKLNNRESKFDKQFNIDFCSQVRNVNSFDYDIYFVVLQTEMSIEPQLRLSIASRQLTKSEVARTKIVNDEMFQQIKYINTSVEKTKVNELYKLISYINLPIDDVFDKKNETVALIPNLDNLQISYLDKNSLRKDVYTKVLWVENLPMNVLDDFNEFENLSDLPYGVEVHVRVTPKIIDHKAIKQVKAIRKTLKKHKQRNTIENDGVTDDEYNVKEQLAKIAQVKLNKDNASLFYVQIALRIKSASEDELKTRVSNIIKRFKRDNIELISNLGHDLIFSKDLIPYHEIKYKKNIHKIEAEYFSKFNFLGGIKVGIETDNSIVQCYTKKSRKPVHIDHMAISQGQTVTSTPNVGFFGQSGSGKSQGANSYMIYDIVYNNATGLIIDPKGDRVDMDSKIPYSSEFLNLVVIGGSKNQAGAFDPFNVYDEEFAQDESKVKELLLNVTDVASTLLRISNSDYIIKSSYITNSFQDYMSVKSKEKSFTEYVESYLSKYSVEYSDEILALKDMMHADLFFRTKDSNRITFDSRLNVIVVDKIKTDPENVSKAEFTIYEKLSKMVMRNINNLIEQFYKHLKNCTNMDNGIIRRPIIMLEEVMTFVQLSGFSLLDNTVRMIRSFGGYAILCTQLFSDLSEGVLEMLGVFFIASAKSEDNFSKVCNHFNLRKNKFMFLRQLEEKTTQKKKQYPFLLVDANGKKAIVEFRFLNMFKEAFNTNLKVDTHA